MRLASSHRTPPSTARKTTRQWADRGLHKRQNRHHTLEPQARITLSIRPSFRDSPGPAGNFQATTTLPQADGSRRGRDPTCFVLAVDVGGCHHRDHGEKVGSAGRHYPWSGGDQGKEVNSGGCSHARRRLSGAPTAARCIFYICPSPLGIGPPSAGVTTMQGSNPFQRRPEMTGPDLTPQIGTRALRRAGKARHRRGTAGHRWELRRYAR
jgi:hypothetical protein